MKNSEEGFGILILVIGLAIVAALAGLYFTRGGETQKSQFETGQDAVQQAKDINFQGSQQSQELKTQMDLQNDLMTQ